MQALDPESGANGDLLQLNGSVTANTSRSMSKSGCVMIPDFRKLHELEEARTAKWKKSHRTQTTVPLAFKLSSTRPLSAPLLAEEKKEEEIGSSAANGMPSSLATAKKTAKVPPLFVFATPKIAKATGTSGPKSSSSSISTSKPARAPLATRKLDVPLSTISNAEELLKKIDLELEKQATASDMTSKRFSVYNVEPKWKSSPSAVRVPAEDKENRIEVKPSTGTRRPSSASSTTSSAAPTNGGNNSSTNNEAGARAATAGTNNSRKESDGAHKVDLARLKRMLSRLEPKQKQQFNSSEFYVFGRVLGEGAYGKVKIATHLLTTEKVAVKTFEKSKLADPNSRRRVTREIRILKALSHPNVIKLFEVIDLPTRKYIIMELAPGGDLCKYVRENRRLSEAEACRLFTQIVDGLLYCHNSGIVHRDVKLDNLLMDEQKNIKIVDFGFSVNFKEGQKLRKACGSPSYAAPEIVSRKPYNPPDVDVWSLGVVLYAMICGYFPFQGSSNQDLCRKIVKGRFETPEWMSPEARDLVRRMLVTDPAKRASLDVVKSHPWCRSSLSPILFGVSMQCPKLHDVDFEKSEDSQDGDRPSVIEANSEIVGDMAEMGFPKEYATHCVTRNLHNITSTSYWLLQHKRVAAMQSKSVLTIV